MLNFALKNNNEKFYKFIAVKHQKLKDYDQKCNKIITNKNFYNNMFKLIRKINTKKDKQ